MKTVFSSILILLAAAALFAQPVEGPAFDQTRAVNESLIRDSQQFQGVFEALGFPVTVNFRYTASAGYLPVAEADFRWDERVYTASGGKCLIWGQEYAKENGNAAFRALKKMLGLKPFKTSYADYGARAILNHLHPTEPGTFGQTKWRDLLKQKGYKDGIVLEDR